MAKRISLFALLILFLFTGLCSAAIRSYGDSFDNTKGFSIDWNFAETMFKKDTSGNAIVPTNDVVGLKFIKEIRNIGKETEREMYWVSLRLVVPNLAFFDGQATYIKIDDEVFKMDYCSSKSWYKSPSASTHMYFPYIESFIGNADIIEKLKTADNVVVRFAYNSDYHPEGRYNETVSVPVEVLSEWKKIIDMR